MSRHDGFVTLARIGFQLFATENGDCAALVVYCAPALERPLSTPTGNVRANVPGRTMAIDPSGTVAYALTTTGLSIVPLDTPPAVNRPAITPNGTVNIASYLPQIAPNGLFSIFGRNLGSPALAGDVPGHGTPGRRDGGAGL